MKQLMILYGLLVLLVASTPTAYAETTQEKYKHHFLDVVTVLETDYPTGQTFVVHLESRESRCHYKVALTLKDSETGSLKITLCEALVADAGGVVIEYFAHHEFCHVKLEHLNLSRDRLRAEALQLELEAERCVKDLVGQVQYAEFIGAVNRYGLQQLAKGVQARRLLEMMQKVAKE